MGATSMPAQARERRPDGEDPRVEPAHVHAERAQHAPVRRARAHQHAGARALDGRTTAPAATPRPAPMISSRYTGTPHRADVRLSAQGRGQGNGESRRPPRHLHQRVGDEDQPERGQQLVHVVARVQVAHHAELHEDGRDAGARERARHAERERARHQGQGATEEGAQHVERRVREVHEVHDAEGQREPRRHQEQQHAELQPVDELRENERRVHARCPRTACLRACTAPRTDPRRLP